MVPPLPVNTPTPRRSSVKAVATAGAGACARSRGPTAAPASANEDEARNWRRDSVTNGCLGMKRSVPGRLGGLGEEVVEREVGERADAHRQGALVGEEQRRVVLRRGLRILVARGHPEEEEQPGRFLGEIGEVLGGAGER